MGWRAELESNDKYYSFILVCSDMLDYTQRAISQNSTTKMSSSWRMYKILHAYSKDVIGRLLRQSS